MLRGQVSGLYNHRYIFFHHISLLLQKYMTLLDFEPMCWNLLVFFPEESLISSVYLRLLLVFPELYCARHVWTLTPLCVCVCLSRAERVYQRLRDGKCIRASGRCDAGFLCWDWDRCSCRTVLFLSRCRDVEAGRLAGAVTGIGFVCLNMSWRDPEGICKLLKYFLHCFGGNLKNLVWSNLSVVKCVWV